MLYTVAYRGWTIWRTDPERPFNVSRTESTDLNTLLIKRAASGLRDFATARREVDCLKS